ncbi:glycosyltransferase family 4 protein [Halomonas citrativorans]|uniref:Glycosyltransferase family 4 protein n=1 Tax=Halomonas citrativorans TaxID=2742612 RepID=A0ABR9FFC0_9GAMM|nr:glycosyltransferase family 1 protein [Halomonas citrativorans]MBE0405179.1 glycosyltransferase family 4 protein [Halomonas citrativorans]
MRIVIDMQGAQTESRYRGIGRYTLSLTQAIVRHRGEHEIILVLNGLFPDTIEPIRAAFDGLLPQDCIRVWRSAGPLLEEQEGNDSRRRAAELVREAFIQSLNPDLVHIPSLFEGFNQDAVLSIGSLDKQTPVSVTLHDLIPLLNPEEYLDKNPPFAAYYRNKVDHLSRAALFLSISESASQEAFDCLGVPPEKVVNTSEAADGMFRKIDISDRERDALLKKLNIDSSFVLYSGGGDERKNLPRLIHAYAALPQALRKKHQLVLAGRIPNGIAVVLKNKARLAGLADDELILTDYITDEELIQLYNLCHLYVFPSWHEGFGLPALEAMACGAPVIGANTSSLPEVIGHPEALFDPMDVTAITNKLQEVLENEGLRQALKTHGETHAKGFTWEHSAQVALSAWEALLAGKHATQPFPLAASQEHLITGLVDEVKEWSNSLKSELSTAIAQNQQAGRARQLLLDVSEIRNNDAATGVQRVVRSYLKALLSSPPAGFQVVPVYATREEGYCYAWQMAHQYGAAIPEGLSEQARNDQAPIHWQRGDIFFALDMQHHVQLMHQTFFRQLQADGVTVKFLVHDLLPIQLADLFKDDDAKQLHEQWLSMIAATDGAICVSKATADAFDEWIEANHIFRTPGFRMTWVHNGGDLDGSKPSSGLPEDADEVLAKIRQRPALLAVSTLEPRKGQELLFDAVQVLWNQGHDINLVLVGTQGWKIDDLAQTLREHPENGKRLFWLEGISDEYLEKVYQASSALVAASINEGFGLSLIEAARYGVPIIARDIPVFREVAQASAFYFQENNGTALAGELAGWLALWKQGKHPLSTHLEWQTWAQSAEQLKTELVENRYPRKQLLVDVSELAQRDARSGIQRVVRSVLKEWLSNPPDGYRVEPVYAAPDEGYRYARRFTLDFMGWPAAALEDELIDYAPGDVFFGLDMQPQVQIAQQPFFQRLRQNGVTVKFLLHDLLPIQMPEFFPPGSEEGFTQWLRSITATDGVICVSRTVADELRVWVGEHGPERERPLQIGWSHNGADIDNSSPSRGMPEDAPEVLAKLEERPSFLMVGTLEPRKGYADALDVFDALWQQGEDVNLVIVGKMGWKVETLAERIKTHSEYNRRLFWLAGISDEYLDKVYSTCTCLIAASYGEGFGLPLIEAAQVGMPIIARDIPVFREVAGDYATYLPADMKKDRAGEVISHWLEDYYKGADFINRNITWKTWKESSSFLIDEVVSAI